MRQCQNGHALAEAGPCPACHRAQKQRHRDRLRKADPAYVPPKRLSANRLLEQALHTIGQMDDAVLMETAPAWIKSAPASEQLAWRRETSAERAGW